jgi:hypothetical protein
MPIHRDQRMLFVHIPKTAGTSVEALLGLLGDWRLENLHTGFGLIQSPALLRCQFGSNFLQHLTLAELRQVFGAELQGCTPFTVVRHPWARLLSSFRRKDPDLCAYYRYRCDRDLNSLDLGAYIDLAGWLDHAHLRPQFQFLIDPNTTQIDHELRIFRQERLDELEYWLAARFGRPMRLPRRNVNVAEAPLPGLDAPTLRRLEGRVRDLYATDYAALGYA